MEIVCDQEGAVCLKPFPCTLTIGKRPVRWLRLLKHPVALWSVALPIQTADCSCSFDEKNPLVERDWGRSVMLWLGLNYSTFFWMYLVHSFPMKKGCRISTMLMNALQEYADHLDLAGKLLTPTFQLAKSTCLPHPPPLLPLWNLWTAQGLLGSCPIVDVRQRSQNKAGFQHHVFNAESNRSKHKYPETKQHASLRVFWEETAHAILYMQITKYPAEKLSICC